MTYDRGDVVLVPFPFVTQRGVRQKARPALVISNNKIQRRFDDVILAGITSRVVQDISDTEFLISEDLPEFSQTGLAKSSIVRCEYIMTIPPRVISRKIGRLPKSLLKKVDEKIRLSLGL